MPLIRKSFIAAALQTVAGTEAAVTGDDVIPVTAIGSAGVYEGQTIERTRMRPELGASEQVNTTPYATVQFTVPLYGSGEPGTAPKIGRLLRACAMREVITAPDTGSGVEGKVDYLPTSQDFEMATIYYVLDDRLQRLTDARGTVTIDLSVASWPTAQFTFTGAYNRPETSPLTGVDFTEAVQELPVNNQNTRVFTVHGRDVEGQSLSVDLGNSVNWVNLVNFEGAEIDDRSVSGQIQLRAETIADHNYFADVESHQGVTTGAIEVVHGATPGNRVGVAGPKVQLSSISDQDTNGRLYYSLGARFLRDAGDDELVLTFS